MKSPFLFVIAWLGVGVAYAAASDPQVNFAGRVLDSQTLKPIANARVQLTRPNLTVIPFMKEGPAELLAVTITDRNGRFKIQAHSRGPFDLTVFRPGPHGARGLANVKPGKPLVIYYRPDPKPHP